MFCDQCGATLAPEAQFCASCGKAVRSGSLRTPTPPQSAMNRVQRHLSVLAALWALSGILRLSGVLWMLIFGEFFLPFLRGWAGPGWPFWHGWPFAWMSWGLYSTGLFLGFFGVLHLVFAWGLFQRQPWARTLGLALAVLALFRIPLGTALGIYTLWVLLPQPSSREYDELCRAYQGRAHVSA
jgi:hypothetical protein